MACHLKGLAGKVALVTGSTSGIGLSIVNHLADLRCNVILNGFGETKHIEDVQTNLKRQNIKVNFFEDDLSTVQGNLTLCDNIYRIYPTGVDILVNNAEWGRIINISSVHGLVASPYKAAYVSAKHGLHGLTKVVALETAGTGVTCNAICPGFVDTPIYQKQVESRSQNDGCSYDEASRRILQLNHPTLQPVGTHQVAKFVEFLCSEAASQITGSCLTMDGGWTAR
ncbi:D-beta-hydroxybutyrate dehydrogenase-like isoform X2 [Mytilus edulis]|uniref:D-beta-hydroxybutyrate dehydrogenase-like isoform X2 n=1 Tax=Mytilus edulis TaxID=6550 RepID=UPI0039EFADF1